MPKPQKYIVLYNFIPTNQRAGIGHSAVWDGQHYWSYGMAGKNEKGLSYISFAASEHDAAMRVEMDEPVYGHPTGIIIPVPDDFEERRAALAQKKKNESADVVYEPDSSDAVIEKQVWSGHDYDFVRQNCSHLSAWVIQTLGCDIGVDDVVNRTQHDRARFLLAPIEVALRASSFGRRVMLTQIQENRTLGHTVDEVENMREFLHLMSIELRDREAEMNTWSLIRKRAPSGILDLRAAVAGFDRHCPPADAIRQFYDVQKILTEKHYAKTTWLTGKHLRKNKSEAFYAHWFRGSLDPRQFVAQSHREMYTDAVEKKDLPALYRAMFNAAAIMCHPDNNQRGWADLLRQHCGSEFDTLHTAFRAEWEKSGGLMNYYNSPTCDGMLDSSFYRYALAVRILNVLGVEPQQVDAAALVEKLVACEQKTAEYLVSGGQKEMHQIFGRPSDNIKERADRLDEYLTTGKITKKEETKPRQYAFFHSRADNDAEIVTKADRKTPKAG